MMLYHVSGWQELRGAAVGSTHTLRPGPQGAEGRGVYFSEGEPRYSAAEGAVSGVVAVIAIPRPVSAQGWYRTKNGACRKHGRPRTWHTQGRDLTVRVEAIAGTVLHCIVL